MAFLLRIIRKNRWYKEEAQPFLDAGDTPADPLGDLRTDRNTLSVWYIEDDKSNLERVIAAFATARPGLDVLDYALFDCSLLSKINVTCERSTGQTPDLLANESWHYNLRDLSGFRLVALAKVILETAEKDRILEDDVRRLIRDAVSKGQVNASLMKPKLAGAISTYNNH